MGGNSRVPSSIASQSVPRRDRSSESHHSSWLACCKDVPKLKLNICFSGKDLVTISIAPPENHRHVGREGLRTFNWSMNRETDPVALRGGLIGAGNVTAIQGRRGNGRQAATDHGNSVRHTGPITLPKAAAASLTLRLESRSRSDGVHHGRRIFPLEHDRLCLLREFLRRHLIFFHLVELRTQACHSPLSFDRAARAPCHYGSRVTRLGEAQHLFAHRHAA